MAGTTGRQDHRGEHRDVTPLPESLPEHIVERLRAENITSCEDWRGLSTRRRRMLFGITHRARIAIDAAVDAALREVCGGSLAREASP